MMKHDYKDVNELVKCDQRRVNQKKEVIKTYKLSSYVKKFLPNL